MVEAAPSSPIADPNADHPSPPSRLLSKHRPRRRTAAPRLQPLAPAPTRGQLDLTLCRCCGVRFPTPATGSKRLSVKPLCSLWRIVLLCAECLSLVRSASICSYCLSLDNLPYKDSSVACRSCSRRVHHYCIPTEHRTVMIQPIDMENFICIDCCPTMKPCSKNRCLASVPKLQAATRDPTFAARGKGAIVAAAKENAVWKTMQAKPASKPVKESLRCGDLHLPDEELALQLHLAMNGSQRISRSGNVPSCGSAEQGKGQNSVVDEKNGSVNQLLCVTNMMDQLDDDESDAELGINGNANHLRQFDPTVTVVLALECVKGKHGQGSMRGKRKGPPMGKLQIGMVDRYRNKYSKKKSRKKANDANTESKILSDGLDRNDGGNGIAHLK